jgi:Rrf2 family iron-sulfur cluster assembly transcriptional regulator
VRLSPAAGYAIRAVLYMAAQAPDRRCEAQEIARQEGIPVQSLWKVLQLLCRGRLLSSVRGTGGGYRLAIPPERIPLIAIVEAVGDSSSKNKCVLRFQDCSPDAPCALHEHWKALREGFFEMLEKTTVADVVRDCQRRKGEPV